MNLKKIWENHKGKIIVGGAVIALTVSAVLLGKKGPETETKLIGDVNSNTEEEPIDYGRDILMTFSDEETGEVLWKERCYESYMNDFKDVGMQYEEVRKLNGIEEA